MNELLVFRCADNATLRRLVAVAAAILTWIALDEGFSLVREMRGEREAVPGVFRILTTHLLPVFAAITIIFVMRLGKQGCRFRLTTAALAGLIFIVGGAALDLTVTLLKSPDLSMEGNPYVRALLDSHYPLWFVYAHLAMTQAAFVFLFCQFWIAFLRHQPILLGGIRAARPRTPLEFLKAATGGAHLSLRQWLMPLRASEMPLLYHSLWAMVLAIVFGITLFRIYAALEWLDFVTPAFASRAVVLFSGLLGSLCAYFLVLERQYRAVQEV